MLSIERDDVVIGRLALPSPVLPADVLRTYRCHLAYTVLGGIGAGILTNAPTIAIKALKAADWHLALPTSLSGVGLFSSLILGIWMARRPKMPFVAIPGFTSCVASAAMVVTSEPLPFLFLLGLTNLFETITRPAMTAIIRANYPVDSRGWVTGRLRRSSAVAFLVSALVTARLLDHAGGREVIQGLLATATVLQTFAYAAVSRIRVRPDPGDAGGDREPDWGALFQASTSMLRHDSRFLRYLAGCFLFGTSALIYDPIVRAFFAGELHLNYTQCVVLVDVLPSLCSVLTVHRLGTWLDRTNPLVAWAVIRAIWGLDPLLLAIAPSWPAGAVLIAAVARLLRGGVMGGSWILWWQLGTNYFAREREDTSVYMGLHLSLNGAQRMCGPPLGAYLGGLLSRRETLAIGGLLVIASAVHAWRQAEAEKVGGRYPTFADKEAPEPVA